MTSGIHYPQFTKDSAIKLANISYTRANDPSVYSSVDNSLTELVASSHGFLPEGRKKHPIAKYSIKWELAALRRSGKSNSEQPRGHQADTLVPHAFLRGLVQDGPDAIEPIEVLGLHEHGPQASQTESVLLCAFPLPAEKGNRNLRDRQMQVPSGSRLKDFSCEDRGFFHVCRARGKNDDIEFR